MIDRHRRDQLAETLRHFAAGLLTNREYGKRVDPLFEGKGQPWKDDLALRAVYEQAWFLYDDNLRHRLKGRHALGAEGRSEIARWIMFLYSDQEYEWPVTRFISISSCLLRIVTLGLCDLIAGPIYARRLEAMGDWSVWPFLDSRSYQEARQKPRLLARH